ncbi:MAG: hypothetical protein RBR86_09975 [Pseudobdellovibrionaceae bacterium]|jgi:hypothetical protein|nr:hypothetical protein [Pseudobdellovibrionaceae bacterium]
MIYPYAHSGSTPLTAETLPAKKQSSQGFVMRKDYNDRTSGSMPVWVGISDSSTEKTAVSKELLDNSSHRNVKAPILNLQEEAQTDVKDGGAPFGFLDFLDIINPLQHIPIISTIYRHITGDEIGAVAQVAGGALFGGAIGAAAGVASAVIEHETGKEVGMALMDAFSSSSQEGDVLDGTTIAFVDLKSRERTYNN